VQANVISRCDRTDRAQTCLGCRVLLWWDKLRRSNENHEAVEATMTASSAPTASYISCGSSTSATQTGM
jgi:hypothetical protein